MDGVKVSTALLDTAFSHYFQTQPNFYQACSKANNWWVTFAEEISGDCTVTTKRFSCRFLLGSLPALTVLSQADSSLQISWKLGAKAKWDFLTQFKLQSQNESAQLSLSYTWVYIAWRQKHILGYCKVEDVAHSCTWEATGSYLTAFVRKLCCSEEHWEGKSRAEWHIEPFWLSLGRDDPSSLSKCCNCGVENGSSQSFVTAQFLHAGRSVCDFR